MERTKVTRIRDFGSFTISSPLRKIRVIVPENNIYQLKAQFKVSHPEQLYGREVFVSLLNHRIYANEGGSKQIGVFCRMEVL